MTLKARESDSQSLRRGWLASIPRVPGGGIAIALLIRVLLFSTVVTLVLTILIRPHGLFGREDIQRI